jgi:hypothetical protein
MERNLRSESDSRPIVVPGPARRGDAGRPRRGRPGGRIAHPALRQARRLRLLLPGDRRATVVEADLGGWPAAHVRLALVGDTVGPGLSAAQNRRGLVVFVSARVIDRPPRGLGRTPGGCLLVVPGEVGGRRPVLEVAGCRGYVAGRTGAAAVVAATGGAA